MTEPTMPKTTGGKGKGRKGTKGTKGRKGSSRRRQNQNQQGGACGNSSSVAAAYGGNVPNILQGQKGGVGLQSTPYGGNQNVTGLTTGGSATSGPINSIVKGGNANPMMMPPQSGGNNPMMPPQAGGNVLNDLAVPAVLLYANNTFGKKRYSGKKRRNYRNKSKRYNKRR